MTRHAEQSQRGQAPRRRGRVSRRTRSKKVTIREITLFHTPKSAAFSCPRGTLRKRGIFPDGAAGVCRAEHAAPVPAFPLGGTARACPWSSKALPSPRVSSSSRMAGGCSRVRWPRGELTPPGVCLCKTLPLVGPAAKISPGPLTNNPGKAYHGAKCIFWKSFRAGPSMGQPSTA